MAVSAMFGDYIIGGISQALGTVSSEEKQEETPNKLKALFDERTENEAVVFEENDKHHLARPISEEGQIIGKKRAFDGSRNGGQSRKKQRENRKEKKSKIKLSDSQGSLGDEGVKMGGNDNPVVEKLSDKEDPERLGRTVFVGNVSVKTTRKELKTLFSTHGNVESVRLRSVPVANAKHSKKVSVIKKEFHPERQTMNAYVVFKDKDSANKSLKDNGSKFKDFHLRVNFADKQLPKTKMCVFVGNLPFSIQDEQLWEHFSDCGEIDDVRVIRDPESGLGKGFAYVTFKNKDSVTFAMKMNNSQLMERRLRVFPAVGKDSIKKPFDKKKDREYRMKDTSSKVATKGKGVFSKDKRKQGNKSSFAGNKGNRNSFAGNKGKKEGYKSGHGKVTSKSKGLHGKSNFSKKVNKKKHAK